MKKYCYKLLNLQIPFFNKKMRQNPANMKIISENYGKNKGKRDKSSILHKETNIILKTEILEKNKKYLDKDKLKLNLEVCIL